MTWRVMSRFLRRLIALDEGQDLIEYALVACLVALLCFLALFVRGRRRRHGVLHVSSGVAVAAAGAGGTAGSGNGGSPSGPTGTGGSGSSSGGAGGSGSGARGGSGSGGTGGGGSGGDNPDPGGTIDTGGATGSGS